MRTMDSFAICLVQSRVLVSQAQATHRSFECFFSPRELLHCLLLLLPTRLAINAIDAKAHVCDLTTYLQRHDYRATSS